MTRRPVRIVPVFRSGKGHEQYADGFIVHPDDRAVREVVAKEEARTKKGKRR